MPLLVIAIAILISTTNSQCLNEKQKPVDWFIGLRIHGPSYPRKYIILDNTSKIWRETEETILIKPIFDKINGLKHQVAAWNDQPPTNATPPSTSYAHAKGVVYFD